MVPEVALVVVPEVAPEVALVLAPEVALVVAPVASGELELGVLEQVRGVMPAPEREVVLRAAAVLEQAAGLASAVAGVGVGQGLGEEERALLVALEEAAEHPVERLCHQENG